MRSKYILLLIITFLSNSILAQESLLWLTPKSAPTNFNNNQYECPLWKDTNSLIDLELLKGNREWIDLQSIIVRDINRDGYCDIFSGFSSSEQRKIPFLLFLYDSKSGIFKKEIVGVSIAQRKGDPLIINEDEEYKNVKFEKIPQLRAAFSKNGTVTAANASTINDGASALILASADAVKKYDLKPIAKILSFADSAQAPQWFTTAPTKAAPKALKLAKMTTNDVDFFEINEAFSVVPLAFNKILDINIDKVNILGGAVSLGHPLGASGARIVTTLNTVLQSKNASVGCAVICNGGGGASSIIIERV